VNSLDIWRKAHIVASLGERSNSEQDTPEIPAQKMNMDIAMCLNIKSRKAHEGQASRIGTP
jgi:hypothetical protein